MDLICSPEDLTTAYQWICDLRVDYSPNNDIWDLRRHWGTLKETLFEEINAGTYEFSSIDVYAYDDAVISLWSGLDMIALKLITNALFAHFTAHFPHTCYHVKDRGGLKKAVKDTVNALSHEVSHEGVDGVTKYHYIFRSDIKSYYESIDFEVLMGIIEQYVDDPILIALLKKALARTECRGGLYTFYANKGLAMGSPLSPLLGAVMLLPLDLAMANHGGKIKDIFYARYMDDWIVLTKTKTALRKVIKKTHQIMANLKLRVHPTKTYIGKISHGFNFLGYYIDDKILLPSSETIRCHEGRDVNGPSALLEAWCTKAV